MVYLYYLNKVLWIVNLYDESTCEWLIKLLDNIQCRNGSHLSSFVRSSICAGCMFLLSYTGLNVFFFACRVAQLSGNEPVRRKVLWQVKIMVATCTAIKGVETQFLHRQWMVTSTDIYSQECPAVASARFLPNWELVDTASA